MYSLTDKCRDWVIQRRELQMVRKRMDTLLQRGSTTSKQQMKDIRISPITHHAYAGGGSPLPAPSVSALNHASSVRSVASSSRRSASSPPANAGGALTSLGAPTSDRDARMLATCCRSSCTSRESRSWSELGGGRTQVCFSADGPLGEGVCVPVVGSARALSARQEAEAEGVVGCASVESWCRKSGGVTKGSISRS